MHFASPDYANGIDSGYAVCIIATMPTGEQIKALRDRLGESQAKFASRFDVNQSTVNRWERHGLPSRGTAKMAVERVLEEIGEARQ